MENCIQQVTYNGYFPTKLVLNLTLLHSIRRLLLDDLEELLNAHVCGGRPGCGKRRVEEDTFGVGKVSCVDAISKYAMTSAGCAVWTETRVLLIGTLLRNFQRVY